jgi:hypothetical protein
MTDSLMSHLSSHNSQTSSDQIRVVLQISITKGEWRQVIETEHYESKESDEKTCRSVSDRLD